MDLEPHQQLDRIGISWNSRTSSRFAAFRRRDLPAGRRARRPRGPPRSAPARHRSAAPAARPASARRRSPSRRLLPGACRSRRARSEPGRLLQFCHRVVVIGVEVVLRPDLRRRRPGRRRAAWRRAAARLFVHLADVVPLTTSFRVSWTSVLVRVFGWPPEEIGVLHHPLLVDQHPAPRRRVLELQRGERLLDSLLGVAVLDDRVGGQLRAAETSRSISSRFGLAATETLAGDREALDVVGRLAGPWIWPKNWRRAR